MPNHAHDSDVLLGGSIHGVGDSRGLFLKFTIRAIQGKQPKKCLALIGLQKPSGSRVGELSRGALPLARLCTGLGGEGKEPTLLVDRGISKETCWVVLVLGSPANSM